MALADTTGADTLPLSKMVQAMPDLRMVLPYLQILEKSKIKYNIRLHLLNQLSSPRGSVSPYATKNSRISKQIGPKRHLLLSSGEYPWQRRERPAASDMASCCFLASCSIERWALGCEIRIQDAGSVRWQRAELVLENLVPSE